MLDFTTTTRNDTVVASILMMGAMQEYFSYSCSIARGFPSVTLLNEKSDYELILKRLDKLATSGKEPTLFCALLKPVMSCFVSTFDDPTSSSVIDFWQRVLSVHNQASGMTYYSGWITAFCFWDENGKFLHNLVGTPRRRRMQDGIRWSTVSYDRARFDSPGWSKVSVTMDDNGDVVEAAGSVGISCSNSGLPLADGSQTLDSIQP